MNEEQNYQDKIAAVREILGAHLDANPDDSDHFGNGIFVCAMDYGERGDKGDMVWYVSRKDGLLRQRKRLTYEWRAYTAEKIAQMLRDESTPSGESLVVALPRAKTVRRAAFGGVCD